MIGSNSTEPTSQNVYPLVLEIMNWDETPGVGTEKWKVGKCLTITATHLGHNEVFTTNLKY